MASRRSRRLRVIRRKLPPTRTFISSLRFVTLAEGRLLLGIVVQVLIEHVR
jgi:hypothetical protein